VKKQYTARIIKLHFQVETRFSSRLYKRDIRLH